MVKQTGVIIFTDIHNSSRLWKKNPEAMFKALNKHDDLLQSKTKHHKGMVVKTIGDSFMIYFNDLQQAIEFCIEILSLFIYNPIIVEDILIRIRIGAAYGQMKTKELKIQNCCLKDFFGNTVNTASRLETHVSTTNSFAISFLNSQKQSIPTTIKKYIQSKGFNIRYELKNSTKSLKFKKSKPSSNCETLLSNECVLNNYKEELKGIGKVKVWIVEPSIKPKK